MEYKERIQLANEGNYSALMALKARTAKMPKTKKPSVFQRLQNDNRKGQGGFPMSKVAQPQAYGIVGDFDSSVKFGSPIHRNEREFGSPKERKDTALKVEERVSMTENNRQKNKPNLKFLQNM